MLSVQRKWPRKLHLSEQRDGFLVGPRGRARPPAGTCELEMLRVWQSCASVQTSLGLIGHSVVRAVLLCGVLEVDL